MSHKNDIISADLLSPDELELRREERRRMAASQDPPGRAGAATRPHAVSSTMTRAVDDSGGAEAPRAPTQQPSPPHQGTTRVPGAEAVPGPDHGAYRDDGTVTYSTATETELPVPAQVVDPEDETRWLNAQNRVLTEQNRILTEQNRILLERQQIIRQADENVAVGQVVEEQEPPGGDEDLEAQVPPATGEEHVPSDENEQSLSERVLEKLGLSGGCSKAWRRMAVVAIILALLIVAIVVPVVLTQRSESTSPGSLTNGGPPTPVPTTDPASTTPSPSTPTTSEGTTTTAAPPATTTTPTPVTTSTPAPVTTTTPAPTTTTTPAPTMTTTPAPSTTTTPAPATTTTPAPVTTTTQAPVTTTTTTQAPITTSTTTTTTTTSTTTTTTPASPTPSQDLIDFLSSISPDGGDALSTFGTPQNEAVDWLAGNSNLRSYSDDKIQQRYALAVLYFSTDGDSWTNSDNWLDDSEECDRWWQNTPSTLQCTDSGAVVELALELNNLQGTVPPEIKLFSESLEMLDLRRNSISGAIPSETGELTKLTYLNIRTNQLSGAIPSSLASLVNLEELYLYENQLTGIIPTFFASLTNLERLSLSDNLLTGTIPSFLASFTNLEWLDLYGNQFIGTFTCPDFIPTCYISCDTSADECRSL